MQLILYPACSFNEDYKLRTRNTNMKTEINFDFQTVSKQENTKHPIISTKKVDKGMNQSTS